MADTYVKLDDVLAKMKFSHELNQYAVAEKDILEAEKIEYAPGETVDRLEEALRVMCNRCYVMFGGTACSWCNMRDLCEKTRTCDSKVVELLTNEE